MLRYMLDTNILIYTIKNRSEVVRQNFEAHDGEICASSITAMELLYGAHRSQPIRRNLDIIEGLFDRLTLLDFDIGAAKKTMPGADPCRGFGASAGTRRSGPFDVS